MESKVGPKIPKLDSLRNKLENSTSQGHLSLPKIKVNRSSKNTPRISRDVSHVLDQTQRIANQRDFEMTSLKSVLNLQNVPEESGLPVDLKELQMDFSLNLQEKFVEHLKKLKLKSLKKHKFSYEKAHEEGMYLFKDNSGLVAQRVSEIYEESSGDAHKRSCSYRIPERVLAPSGRREAELLNEWLSYMVATHVTKASSKTQEQRVRVSQLIYTLAFREVMRQVSVHCTERGALLKKLWNSQIETYCQHEDHTLHKVSQLKKKCKDKANQHALKLQGTIANLTEKSNNLQSTLETRNNQIAELENTLNSKQKEIQNLRLRLENLNDLVDSLNQRIGSEKQTKASQTEEKLQQESTQTFLTVLHGSTQTPPSSYTKHLFKLLVGIFAIKQSSKLSISNDNFTQLMKDRYLCKEQKTLIQNKNEIQTLVFAFNIQKQPTPSSFSLEFLEPIRVNPTVKTDPKKKLTTKKTQTNTKKTQTNNKQDFAEKSNSRSNSKRQTPSHGHLLEVPSTASMDVSEDQKLGNFYRNISELKYQIENACNEDSSKDISKRAHKVYSLIEKLYPLYKTNQLNPSVSHARTQTEDCTAQQSPSISLKSKSKKLLEKTDKLQSTDIQEFKLGQIQKKTPKNNSAEKLLNEVMGEIPVAKPHLSLKSLIKIIDSVHSRKITLCRENKNYLKQEAFSVLYEVLMNNYGLKSVAEKKFKEVVKSVSYFSKTHSQVSNFWEFLQVKEGLEDWNFYLKTVEYLTYLRVGSLGFNEEIPVHQSVPYEVVTNLANILFQNKLSQPKFEEMLNELDKLKVESKAKNLKKQDNSYVDSDEMFLVMLEYQKTLEVVLKVFLEEKSLLQSTTLTLEEFTNLLSELGNSQEAEQAFEARCVSSEDTEFKEIPSRGALAYCVERNLANLPLLCNKYLN